MNLAATSRRSHRMGTRSTSPALPAAETSGPWARRPTSSSRTRSTRAGSGRHPADELSTSKMEHGVWQPARRYESKLLDSIGFKCRLNAVARDGLVLGVVSVHDFGKFHRMVFVHYDPASKEWKGPLVDAPFNQPNIDGACPMFTAGGDKMIWSAGYDRGPGPVSSAGGTGSTYDLFWLKTSDIVAYYKAKAGLS